MAFHIVEQGYSSHAATALPLLAGVPWLERLQAWHRQGAGAFLGLPGATGELEKGQHWARLIASRARRLVVFGIGGSSLGGRMLVRALTGHGMPVRFFDNIDPDLLEDFSAMDWRESFLLVVSKSGGTAETLAQFLTVLPILEACCPGEWSRRVAVVTRDDGTPLGRLARQAGIPVIPHPPVGGRFSVLSVVGLLPAAVAGGNVAELLNGAAAMAQRCLQPDPLENPALSMALARYQWARAGRDISVSMVYGERLADIPAWVAQLEAESLGKRRPDGQPAGLTPMTARGVTDQHSLLQLFLDGPEDKQYTLFHDPALAQRGAVMATRGVSIPEVAVLAGKRTGELFEAEFLGTREELMARGNPVRTLDIATGDAAALGAAIVLLETEVALLGLIMGVDPFDQPAVEAGKIRARRYLAAMSRERENP